MWPSLKNEKALLIYCHSQPKHKVPFLFYWPQFHRVTKDVPLVSGSGNFLEPQVAKYSHLL